MNSILTGNDDWSPICLSAEIGLETARGYAIAGRAVVVWRDAYGCAHVWDDHCPHRGDPLSAGIVSGGLITCVSHGWRFDINGQQVRPLAIASRPRGTCFVPTYASKEFDGAIWARLAAPRENLD